MLPVQFSAAADRDLDELLAYVSSHDSPGSATRLLDRLDQTWATLAEFPQRGVVPPELAAMGRSEFREIFFKPYRIVYQVFPDRAAILLIADGRRNLQALLQRRLLGA